MNNHSLTVAELELAQFFHAVFTPLQGAMAYTEMALIEAGQQPDMVERIKGIQMSLSDVAFTIRNFQTSATALRDCLKLKTRLIRANEYIEIVRDCLKASAAMRSVRVSDVNWEVEDFSIPPSSEFYFQGDEQLIRNALSNLIDNAFKYSARKTTVRISVSVNSEQFSISVANEGLHLSNEDCQKVSQRGWRGREAKAISSGTGQGLWIAARIVEQHGGSIQLFPTTNGVTRAVLSLPTCQQTSNLK